MEPSLAGGLGEGSLSRAGCGVLGASWRDCTSQSARPALDTRHRPSDLRGGSQLGRRSQLPAP